jgi:hypothetical protein
MADENGAGRRDRRRTRADYERGLPGYHDPTAGFGGSSPARSALTLRALLAVFGLVVSAGGAWLAFVAGLPALGWVLAVVAVVALVDLVWILVRKRRGEPG